MVTRWAGAVALVWLAALGFADAPRAQACDGVWQPGSGLPGSNGRILATLALPNGDVMVAGEFADVGGLQAVDRRVDDGRERPQRVGQHVGPHAQR